MRHTGVRRSRSVHISFNWIILWRDALVCHSHITEKTTRFFDPNVCNLCAYGIFHTRKFAFHERNNMWNDLLGSKLKSVVLYWARPLHTTEHGAHRISHLWQKQSKIENPSFEGTNPYNGICLHSISAHLLWVGWLGLIWAPLCTQHVFAAVVYLFLMYRWAVRVVCSLFIHCFLQMSGEYVPLFNML